MKKGQEKNTKPINLAVVGYGYWGPNIVRNLNEISDVNLIACCDKREDQLEIIRKKYPNITATSNLEELLTNPQIDGVIVATPTKTHFTIAKKILEAGKNVWIEKPMTETSEQAKILLSIAKRKKKVIHVGHVFIYTEAVTTIKKMIQKKQLGDLYYFDSVRINLGLFQHDVNVIWDLAPHDISIMLYLLDEKPRAVSVFASSHVVKNLEDTAYLSFKFKSGKSAHIHVSWLSPVKIRRSIIAGSKKMVLYDDLEDQSKIKVYDKGLAFRKKMKPSSSTLGYHYRLGDMFTPAIASKEALQTECIEFIEAIRKRKPTKTSGQEGLMVVKILESATLSMKNNGEFKEIKF